MTRPPVLPPATQALPPTTEPTPDLSADARGDGYGSADVAGRLQAAVEAISAIALGIATRVEAMEQAHAAAMGALRSDLVEYQSAVDRFVAEILGASGAAIALERAHADQNRAKAAECRASGQPEQAEWFERIAAQHAKRAGDLLKSDRGRAAESERASRAAGIAAARAYLSRGCSAAADSSATEFQAPVDGPPLVLLGSGSASHLRAWRGAVA